MRQLKQVIRFASVGILVTFASTIPKSPAYANASGCSSSFPSGFSGTTCIDVVGTGLQVNSATGRFRSAVPSLCYWHYSFRFYNTSGIFLTSATGPVYQGCSSSGSWSKSWNPAFNASAGKVCAQLYRRTSSTGSNIYVDAACVNITR